MSRTLEINRCIRSDFIDAIVSFPPIGSAAYFFIALPVNKPIARGCDAARHRPTDNQEISGMPQRNSDRGEALRPLRRACARCILQRDHTATNKRPNAVKRQPARPSPTARLRSKLRAKRRRQRARVKP